MERYRFTSRMEQIMKTANELASPNYIEPVHFFLAACKECTGVCGELYLYLSKRIGTTFIEDILNLCSFPVDKESYQLVNNYKVTNFSKQVFERAQDKMTKYNQVFINEGHLIDSILSTCDIPLIDKEMKLKIINIVAVPRDLTVHLKDFSFQNLELNNGIEVRQATNDDYEELRKFVINEFGDRWNMAINNGFQNKSEIPIYISKLNKEIVGFSCFDVVGNKKGLFGPMGTSRKHRVYGIGKLLLHKSLESMELIGYEYAIIGQAGPIEFYEKNCGAKLIPLNTKELE